ncbi:MAG: hypothetical protein RIC16_02265 [Rhodospirillales bacterium]
MTAAAMLIIALVIVVPLVLPWFQGRGYGVGLLDHPSLHADEDGRRASEDRIRFRLPPSPGEHIQAATEQHEHTSGNHERLRRRVIGLIERHPDRGAEVIRDWMHQ